MKKLLVVCSVLCAAYAGPAVGQREKPVPSLDEFRDSGGTVHKWEGKMLDPNYRLILALVSAAVGSPLCPRAHYKKTLAEKAVTMMKAAGRWDQAEWKRMTDLHISVYRSLAASGGRASVCASIRATAVQEGNPFLTFDPK